MPETELFISKSINYSELRLSTMKKLTIVTSLGIAGMVILGGVMAKTNPEQPAYQEYAVQRLATTLKTDVCKKAPGLLENLVKFNCPQFVDSANPKIREIITNSTERQNYLLFSIYHTDLKLHSLLPSYKVETVGIFNNFYTYSSNLN